MIDIKRFSGILNKDDKESDILPVQHIQARNGRFFGGPNGLSFQNVKGNYVVLNSNLPGGTNECIGAFFDSVNQRIIWFNYNSYGNHGIYSLAIQTGTITQIFRCGVNSATDILTFSLDYPVHSAAIVYRTTGDGDLLYWTDGYNEPRYLNLDTVSSLSPFTESMINACKNAPLAPPTVAYADDATVNVNNLRKKLFRACYRWKYANDEKSTFSPISKVAFNASGYALNTQNDPTKNNNIAITLTAGGNDSTAIEVCGQFNVNDTWGDFFLIDTLDLTDYNISPGGTFIYSFYNNGAYPTISAGETDLYFSWLPDKANTLEVLNGNTIIYGGITEGYDQLQRADVDVTVTVASAAPNVPTISFAYSGAHEITIYIGPVITAGAVYSVYFIYNSGAGGDASPKNISYTTVLGQSQNDVVNSIASLLNGNNISATNLGAGYLRVITTTGSGSITNVIVGVSIAGSEVAAQAWKWSCPGRLGLVYFDDRGKTNGVISFVGDSADSTDFAFTTPNFSTNSNIAQVPVVSASINHTPPTWATSYQWVRANLLPTKFTYWTTNDYYAETDYLYFCIQNLIYTGQQNTGFIPSYEFTEGDRIRVIAAYTGGNFVPYNTQLDFEILGTVEKTMHSPASAGTFIKVAKPTTLPSAAYQYQMLVEIYTPKQAVANQSQLFYEWGEKYDIYTSGGNRYHRGGVADQTASQPATFQWFDGDVYYRGRSYYENAGGIVLLTEYFMDANYSDYFQSAVNSNGRGWVIDLNAQQRYNGVLSRWGGKYQQDTSINQLNIFYPSDMDTIDLAKGSIQRFKVRDRVLRVFQDRGVGQYGIYAKYIQNNAGDNQLVTTNDIITANNINYYQGTYGLSGYPTNLCSSAIADYFVDVVTGREVRLSGDGMTDLGLLYKGQFYFSGLVTPYNRQILRGNGSIAKVIKFWDSFENEAHTVLQAGTLSGTSYADYNYSFNENRNGFCCDQYDYAPEWALSANDIIYSWKNGNIYKHDVSGNNYCNFYGLQYNCEITVVFNPNVLEKKSWQSISQLASDIFNCPTIYTNINSYGTQRQETNLVAAEFTTLEGMPTSAIKRDSNSIGGKVNGAFMKGNWLAVKFQKINASNLVTLNEVSAYFIDSPLTNT